MKKKKPSKYDEVFKLDMSFEQALGLTFDAPKKSTKTTKQNKGKKKE